MNLPDTVACIQCNLHFQRIFERSCSRFYRTLLGLKIADCAEVFEIECQSRDEANSFAVGWWKFNLIISKEIGDGIIQEDDI